jgi:hypothetical protein
LFYYCTKNQLTQAQGKPANELVSCFPEEYVRQSYGQYAQLFFQMGIDTDGDGSAVGDSDDEDLGQ